MKIAVGLSGGVDSSVAAALLKEQGHDVSGLTMKVWDDTGEDKVQCKPACIGPAEKDDIEHARQVAGQLHIPFNIIDVTKEYKKLIVNYFTDEYRKGKTPNPCIYCNQRIKFGILLEKALESGIVFDHFATGHYAKVEYNSVHKRYCLKKAKCLEKDQSYFLAMLNQEQLARVIFPLSNYTKTEVRQLSRRFGLITAAQPESQDFYSGDYTDLFPGLPGSGPIVDIEGREVGVHKGIIHYTIGQRRGLGISHSGPLYVIDIDSQHNKLIVGTGDKLLRASLVAKDVNWVSVEKITTPVKAQVKIRYMHAGAEAELTLLPDNSVNVSFYQPVRAVAPGQIAVFYLDDTVLGAGVIDKKESC